MVKNLHVLMAGLAVGTIATLTGCAGGPETTTSPAPSPQAVEPQTVPNVTALEVPEDTEAGRPRVVETMTLPPPASDPMAMVFQMRPGDNEPIGTEVIRLSFPSPDQAIAVVTQTELPDDSVESIRTRYIFRSVEQATDGPQLWEVVQVTQQNRCQPGRGPQDWTGENCL